MCDLKRYHVYKGSIFLSLLGDLKLYKLTNKSEKHGDMQYKTGLNVDVLQWNPVGKCSSGGLYFFDEIQLLDYNRYFDDAYYIRPVTILNYSDVYVEKGKYKVHEFVLGERARWNRNPIKWVRWTSSIARDTALKRSSSYIKYVPREYLNYTMCMQAVTDDGKNLKHIPNMLKSKEMCMIALDRDILLRYVPSRLRTYDVVQKAVLLNGINIKYVRRGRMLNEELCVEAVKQDGFNIKYVPKRLLTERVCLEAVRSKSFAIEYIPIDRRTKTVCQEAVRRYSFNIKHVPEKYIDDDMCTEIVERLGYCLSYIPIQFITLNLCKIAVKDNPSNIKYVPYSYRSMI